MEIYTVFIYDRVNLVEVLAVLKLTYKFNTNKITGDVLFVGINEVIINLI